MLDPKALGAASSLDVGIFLVGLAIGGILDAVTNVAEFTEPAIFGGLCVAGALGVKNIIAALALRRSVDR
jgi:hypothetical protein